MYSSFGWNFSLHTCLWLAYVWYVSASESQYAHHSRATAVENNNNLIKLNTFKLILRLCTANNWNRTKAKNEMNWKIRTRFLFNLLFFFTHYLSLVGWLTGCLVRFRAKHFYLFIFYTLALANWIPDNSSAFFLLRHRKSCAACDAGCAKTEESVIMWLMCPQRGRVMRLLGWRQNCAKRLTTKKVSIRRKTTTTSAKTIKTMRKVWPSHNSGKLNDDYADNFF